MHRAAVVQYHTSADSAEHNRALIENVLAELTARDPGGLDYQVLQFEDGTGFLHVAVFDGTSDAFADCEADRKFHRDLEQRLATPPIVSRARLIGAYFGRNR
ncbi:hypothetical protein [Mycobacterium sp. UM_CSW]|uniref:hypothetical protein n=1 Tax=Mycobacterium sp. UM_CSW TaxID=1370119 RepID=UPI000424695B|nr:hypothetical protein [Mycobacterium sp. UM_CSW]